MAQRIVLVDDLDGTDGAETVGFALDGVSYEIDLNDKNATRFRESFAEYVQHARRTAGRSTRKVGTSNGAAVPSVNGRKRKKSSSADTKTVRAWAGEQGLEMSGRGRIPQHIEEAYAAAH